MKFKVVVDQNGVRWLLDDSSGKVFDGETWREQGPGTYAVIGEDTIEGFLTSVRQAPLQEF